MAHEPSRNVLARAALYRGVDKEEAMTQPTHSTSSTPAMAQHPAMLAIDNARTRMLEALRLLHERSVELERAALEAPARDAGREGNRAPHYFQIGGLTGDMCDLCGNHRDSPWHLGVLNLDTPEASGTAREAPSRSSATGSASLTPTEQPPPAWDAEAFIDKHHERRGLYHLERPRLMHLVRDAYTAGQRDAGVQVPEKMPEWLPELLNKFMWCNSSFADFGIDEPGFYAALRTHLTQTREG
jgi:hypothetical protein